MARCENCWWYGKPIECPADFDVDTHNCKNFKQRDVVKSGWSGGKDSTCAVYKRLEQQYDVKENESLSKEYIICGFSGIGKSTAEQKHRRIIDFESTGYSHIWKNGAAKGKNPKFPRNYIDMLIKLIDNDEATFYLMSCHEEVRKELKNREIDYIIVLPTVEQKNEYLKRWLKRGSDMEFIKSMNDRWEDMIKSCEEDDAPKIYLSSGEYISDLICL